jgi:hypothetical protein
LPYKAATDHTQRQLGDMVGSQDRSDAQDVHQDDLEDEPEALTGEVYVPLDPQPAAAAVP